MNLSCEEEMLPAGDTPQHPRQATPPLLDGQLLPANFRLVSGTPPRDILSRSEVLTNMLENDTINRPDPDYFAFQPHITLSMRTIVTSWMRDVCDEEGFLECVFPRATIIMDRFLSVHRIEHTSFQLLGATCLLLSSKWAGSVITCDRLAFFTAHSITAEMLRDWELLVMLELDWDVYSLTPNEFIEPLLHRLPTCWDPAILKKEIILYTTFCCIDYSYSVYKASTIAAACFAVAIKKSRLSQEVVEDVLSQVALLAQVPMEVMTSLGEEIKMKQEAAKRGENYQVPGQNPGGHREPQRLDRMDEEESMLDKLAEFGELEQAESPTDVRDIDF